MSVNVRDQRPESPIPLIEITLSNKKISHRQSEKTARKCESIKYIPRTFWPKGGFPIEIETQISKLITYSLTIFII